MEWSGSASRRASHTTPTSQALQATAGQPPCARTAALRCVDPQETARLQNLMCAGEVYIVECGSSKAFRSVQQR
eukprot:533345-Rhodomonas_salina.4